MWTAVCTLSHSQPTSVGLSPKILNFELAKLGKTELFEKGQTSNIVRGENGPNLGQISLNSNSKYYQMFSNFEHFQTWCFVLP